MQQTPPTHRDRLEAFNRKAILDAVIRVLSTQGQARLTMERVAAEAGLAKGTLYLYFKNKGQLLQSVKEASLQPLHDEFLALLNGPQPPDKKLRKLVGRHLSYFDEHRGFFRVLLMERQSAEEQRRRWQSDLYRSLLEKISQVIADGVRLGLFKPLEPAKVGAMLLEANIAVIRQRLWSEKPRPVDEDAGLLMEVFLNGLCLQTTTAPAATPTGDAP